MGRWELTCEIKCVLLLRIKGALCLLPIEPSQNFIYNIFFYFRGCDLVDGTPILDVKVRSGYNEGNMEWIERRGQTVLYLQILYANAHY